LSFYRSGGPKRIGAAVLIEATVVGLVGLAAYKALRPGKGVMTPKRRLVFQHALNKVDPPLSPDQLLELAEIMDSEQLPAYSEILRKRAAMRAQSPELKAAHRAAYRKARSSSDPLNVRIAANAFESQGKTAIAADLRNYADSLEVAAAMAPTAGGAAVAATEAGVPAPPPAESPASAAVTAPVTPADSGSYTTYKIYDSATNVLSGTSSTQPPHDIYHYWVAEKYENGQLVSRTSEPSAAVSGESAFGEETAFGGPSSVIVAASAKPAVVAPPSGVGIAPQGTSELQGAPSGNADPNGPAAQLGMTDVQYTAFMAGQPVQ